MKSQPKNMAASVRARLAEIAVRNRYDFQQVLTSYAIERLLFRLSVSEHAQSFVLKGATLFTLWEGFPHRQTRDVDFLGFGENDVPAMVAVFQQICDMPVKEDGLRFGINSGETIRGLQEYGGIRLHLTVALERAVIPLGVDIGFGDSVTPAPKLVEFPTLLDSPKPNLRVYPAETVIAEKFEAMVRLDMANSRMKDFFDIFYLARTKAFDGKILSAAIAATFERRSSILPKELPISLTGEFADNPAKLAQWRAFCKRNARMKTEIPFGELVLFIGAFLLPILQKLAVDRPFTLSWEPGGPWK